MNCRLVAVLLTSILAGLISAATAQDAGRAILVDVLHGQTTSDTALENQTKPQVVEDKAFGGRAMKVAFAAGDTIGQRAKIPNWKPFTFLQFDVLNPAVAAVDLELNILHSQSKNYQMRVVSLVTLQPGKQQISISLAKLKNVNGSVPELGSVTRWYLADVNNQAPTLLFGNLVLVAQDAGNAKPTPVVHLQGDPRRLKRIREAIMPAIDQPTLFDSPTADAVMSALEIFPENNPWNLMVSDWPRHPNSQAIVASIGADKPLRYNADMNFVLVPPNQPRVEVKLTDYTDESDRGPYPVPENAPIEGWPASFAESAEKISLEDVQRDRQDHGGDRHAIVVDPISRIAYEFYGMKKTDGGWQAMQASIFDLKSNKLRPDSWTSTDAAGLPLIPAVVRHDELQRRKIEHALRVTVQRSRKDYVYPATHHAGHADDPNLPRMGERLRLRADFPLAGFSPETTAILQCLKTYGMLVADNGLSWSISVTPDARIPSLHEELRKLKGADFEVIVPPPGYEPPLE